LCYLLWPPFAARSSAQIPGLGLLRHARPLIDYVYLSGAMFLLLYAWKEVSGQDYLVATIVAASAGAIAFHLLLRLRTAYRFTNST
jgi:hypothetical protein